MLWIVAGTNSKRRISPKKSDRTCTVPQRRSAAIRSQVPRSAAGHLVTLRPSQWPTPSVSRVTGSIRVEFPEGCKQDLKQTKRTKRTQKDSNKKQNEPRQTQKQANRTRANTTNKQTTKRHKKKTTHNEREGNTDVKN